MRLAITGSIATDHLLTFDGRFVDSVLPDQLAHLSLSFLASDLQVRRGGTAGNIAFGLGVLGLSPVLVGAVGADADDYLAWLTDHGVDVSGVLRSEKSATARFTCLTDRDLNQIASFYPGASTEAVSIELATLGAFDLVLVAPTDPAAMARHTVEAHRRGIPVAADPSQQLAYLDGPAITQLVEGATWLFSNEYEAGLIHEKTGWSPEQVLERVGTRVTTLGARGARISRAGQPDIEIGVVPATGQLEPTGVGDGFRSGFLAGQAWGLGLERSAQLGALLATHVVETVGPQEYVFDPERALARFTDAYGADAAAEVAPFLS
jgi:adenosine kinase